MISGIGTILSGVEGRTRPELELFKYGAKTDVYNIPYPTSGDLNDSNFKVSSKEEGRQLKIFENQAIGLSRAHSPLASHGIIVTQGVFFDKSNHPENNLIVTTSGVDGYISNYFFGRVSQEFVWSGLDHSNPNYLWLSLIEEPSSVINHKSTGEFRQVITQSTTTLTGPKDSVLVATFTSGIGFNTIPQGFVQVPPLSSHTLQNQNPHTTKLFQDDILCSGITFIDLFVWNNAIHSGLSQKIQSGLNVSNITYLNNLTQYGKLITSGLLGNIHSGNLAFSFFDNFTDLEADPGNAGMVCVTSGMSISGSRFRNHMTMLPNRTIDGLDIGNLKPWISNICISGNNSSGHTHFFSQSSGMSVWLEPLYPNMVIKPDFLIHPPFVGRRQDKPFEFNTDFGNGRPTLRHKGQYDSTIYIRQLIPYGYNVVESLEIYNKIDSGSRAMTLSIRDCGGTLLTPYRGNVLTSSGAHVMLVSGIPQAGFSQQLPFDLEITFDGVSGVSQYLGTIKTNYLSKS